MAFQSVWYYTDLPEDIVNIIERDLTKTFDSEMSDSRLSGDALNKEKRNSQNTWIPNPSLGSRFFVALCSTC